MGNTIHKKAALTHFYMPLLNRIHQTVQKPRLVALLTHHVQMDAALIQHSIRYKGAL